VYLTGSMPMLSCFDSFFPENRNAGLRSSHRLRSSSLLHTAKAQKLPPRAARNRGAPSSAASLRLLAVYLRWASARRLFNGQPAAWMVPRGVVGPSAGFGAKRRSGRAHCGGSSAAGGRLPCHTAPIPYCVGGRPYHMSPRKITE
jgi:hypothetical protein